MIKKTENPALPTPAQVNSDEGAALLHRRSLLQLAVAAGVLMPFGRLWASSELTEDQAYELGLEAYIYAFPLTYFGRYRYRHLTAPEAIFGTPLQIGEFRHINRPTDASLQGAPQTDTLYSLVYGDLRQEPLLIVVPATHGRYWSLQCTDFFGMTFAMPNRRNFPAEGGLVALVGPDWKGTLPDEVTMTCRAAMPWTFNALRLQVGSGSDRDVAIAIQQGFGTISLSAWLAGEEPNHETGEVQQDGLKLTSGWQAPAYEPIVPLPRVQDHPLADFELLQAMWLDCPPPSKDAALLARFAVIGLGDGQSGGFDQLPEAVRKGMARAEVDGMAKIIASTNPVAGDITANGWTLPMPTLGLDYGDDYLYRAAVTLLGTIATPIDENIYMQLAKAPDGELLSGENRYELRYEKDKMPEVGAFWSLHAYTYDGFTLIDNPIDRYALQSRSESLKHGADGSLTIYVQATDPGPDKYDNWLPVADGDPFFLLTRAYEPQGEMKALRWAGPKLIQVN